MLRETFLMLLTVAALSSQFAVAQPARGAVVTMEDIKKAWQDRQDKVKTLKMSWKRVVVKPKGSLDNLVSMYDDSKISAPQPPRELRLIGETDFDLADDRFRYECRRESWWMPSQSQKPFRHTAIFDGKDYRHSEGFVDDLAKQTSAVQPSSQASLSLDLLELLPVKWCARGAKGISGEDPLAAYEVTGRSFQLRGVACVELEAKSRSADSTRRLTLTADKYLPLRYVSVVRGQIATQLDIEFGMTGSELMPNKWRYVTLSRAGGTRESFEANVTHCDIGATVALSQFQLQLTPGTVVVDTRHSGGEEVAVVLQDGTMSSGVKRGKVKNYEELVDAVKPRPSWQLWVLALVLGAMACIGSYVLMARRRRAT